jgi:excisionase family DNA binding protein
MPKAQTNAATRLLRLKPASQYLSVSCWQLRRLVQSNEIPLVKIGEGGPWLVDIRDLDKFIDRHKTTVD